jgi:hypothetical protein
MAGHYFARARSLPADRVQLRKMVEHLGIAPNILAWEAGVYLSTPMLEMKLESRKGIAPFFAVLQTAAWAARPTGLKGEQPHGSGLLRCNLAIFLEIDVEPSISRRGQLP